MSYQIKLNSEVITEKGINFALRQHEFFNLPEVEIDLENVSKQEIQELINDYANAQLGLITLLSAIAEEYISTKELKTVLINNQFIGNNYDLN